MKKRIGIAAVFIIGWTSVIGSDLFPKISGWKMQEESRVYNSADLWELIDGAAEIFLSYNFEDLHIAEYSLKNQIVRVELYNHRSLEDTYGMYSAERMPDYPMVSIGSQGYKSQGILNFMAGHYYVKIMSIGTEEVAENVLYMMAEKVNTQLAQPTGIPAEIGLLPKEGMITLSDNYIAQNFLGYSCFHSAFSAKYEKPTDFQLFIIHLTASEIQNMLDQYIQMIKEDKVSKKGNMLVVQDLFNGVIYLQAKGDYLAGVLNTNNEEVASEYINKVLSRIP